MPSNETTLVVGATGLLGTEVVRLLSSRGERVRAMVRARSQPEKKALLRTYTDDLVTADLKDPSSLEAACRGVTNIVSTASASSGASIDPADTLQSVDLVGQLDLVRVARASGVRRFVFVSVPETGDSPFLNAKRQVEQALRTSGLTHTILRPSFFSEVWLSPGLGFDPLGGQVLVYGTGERPVNWISIRDVARFAAAALTTDTLAGETIALGGPEAISLNHIVAILQELGAPAFQVARISEAELLNRIQHAKDIREASLAGIMLVAANGFVVDVSRALQLVPGQLRSVRDHLRDLLAAVSS